MAEDAATPGAAAAPIPRKRTSFFGSLFPKKDHSATGAAAPAVPAKDLPMKEETVADASMATSSTVPAESTTPVVASTHKTEGEMAAVGAVGAAAIPMAATDAEEKKMAASPARASFFDKLKAKAKETMNQEPYSNRSPAAAAATQEAPGTHLAKEHETAALPKKSMEVPTTTGTSDAAMTTPVAHAVEPTAAPAATAPVTSGTTGAIESVFAPSSTETPATSGVGMAAAGAATAAAAGTAALADGKRRTSFFAGFGKKERKVSGSETENMEAAAGSTPVVAEKAKSPMPATDKKGGLGSLARKFSRSKSGERGMGAEKKAINAPEKVVEEPSMAAKGAEEMKTNGSALENTEAAPAPSAMGHNAASTAEAHDSQIKDGAIGDVVPSAVSAGKPLESETKVVGETGTAMHAEPTAV